ncbi:hypothetical protein SISNIDRAFT_486366 [Sistotremastrum niveocremeum HHB9708]|uniref:Uncharacterized protein n=1 Tax=Sistotremastrum niveocremeum HHB9708 TaxID=1314777 RepID=A0A164U2Q4_9AGAM|nr:hypothetical protein SISNIDRAFT_486366 [Sistotremastrum niveocremeum HHB9708]
MPPVRVHSQPVTDGVQVFRLNASAADLPKADDPHNSSQRSHLSKEIAITSRSSPARAASEGPQPDLQSEIRARTTLATFPSPQERSASTSNAKIKLSSKSTRQKTPERHSYAMGEQVSLQFVDSDTPAHWNYDSDTTEWCHFPSLPFFDVSIRLSLIFRNGHQIILKLDRAAARSLLKAINAAFVQSRQSSLAPSSPEIAQRHLSPFDPSPVIQDPDHPYRQPPTRLTRTTRQGPHWILWRESASTLLTDHVRSAIGPLVSADSASAGDVYELRYTATDKTIWVRQEGPQWLEVFLGSHHPLIPEYVLYIRDDATGPSWIKLETQKKYQRELEKARLM